MFEPPQARPDVVQVLLAQQGWPAPPQAAQVPATQATWLAVQKVVVLPPVVIEQQGWPAPPQVPQLPPAQVPGRFGQAAPAAEQTLLTQQPTGPPLATLPQPLPTQQA
jgi:hypothetical protein